MQPRPWRQRPVDIADAMDRISEYIHGMDEQSFRADQRTVDAVKHNLEIIGEAAKHVPDSVVAEFPALPWREMRAMRNVIAHGYFSLNQSILWTTATVSIPQARTLIEVAIAKSRTMPE